MFRVIATAVVIALGLTLAVEARADVYRIPKSGAPALVADAPEGWSETYDEYGNLQFLEASKAGALQLSWISDPRVETTSDDELAAEVFKAAGTTPYTRRERGAIDGRAGTAFIGTLTINGVPLEMRVVLVRVDAVHCAALTTLRKPDITPAQGAQLAELIAKVRIVRQ